MTKVTRGWSVGNMHKRVRCLAIAGLDARITLRQMRQLMRWLCMEYQCAWCLYMLMKFVH